MERERELWCVQLFTFFNSKVKKKLFYFQPRPCHRRHQTNHVVPYYLWYAAPVYSNLWRKNGEDPYGTQTRFVVPNPAIPQRSRVLALDLVRGIILSLAALDCIFFVPPPIF